MGNIIRRNQAIPVNARRVDEPDPADPATIYTHRLATDSANQAGVTQNFIYVAAPATPPLVPPGPHELHIYNTNVYQSPRNRRSVLGTSFLGTMGLVIGVLGCGAASVPQLLTSAKLIAEISASVAGAGMIGAILFRRVGRGMPLLGLIASAAAFALWMKNSGQLPGQYQQWLANSPVATPTIAQPITPAPTAIVKPSLPHLQDHSIFGDGTGWTNPAEEPATVAREPAHFGSAPTPADLNTAIANLGTARSTAAKRMGLDYLAAKATSEKADADYQQAKVSYSLGSPELLAISQKRLEANSQLNQINGQLRLDPAVAAAEQSLKTAKTEKY